MCRRELRNKTQEMSFLSDKKYNFLSELPLHCDIQASQRASSSRLRMSETDFEEAGLCFFAGSVVRAGIEHITVACDAFLKRPLVQ
jgi:hypothetical protein